MISVSGRAKRRSTRPRARNTYIALMIAAILGLWVLYSLFARFYQKSKGLYSNLRCGTCALVTNSGHLIGANAGRRIDSNDCVFRINNAPTINFEDIVGSKTTIRIIASEALDKILNYEAGKETLGNVVYIYHRGDMNEGLHHLVSKAGEFSAVHVLDDDNRKQVDSVFHSSVFVGTNATINTAAPPSAGLVTFLIALEVCQDELNIYGLVPPHHCEKYKDYYDAPRDYFPPGDQISSCPMRMETTTRFSSSYFFPEETVAVQELTKNNLKVKFHEPIWPPQRRP